MPLNHYEWTEFDGMTWLHVSSGIHGPPTVPLPNIYERYGTFSVIRDISLVFDMI